MKPDSKLEQFRLISGFNDIFVCLACILLLVGIAAASSALSWQVQALLVAILAVALAEYLTRILRLALTSIILVVVFSFSLTACLLGLTTFNEDTLFPQGEFQSSVSIRSSGVLWGSPVTLTLVGLAVLAHWYRYRVPISIAIAAAFLVALVVNLYVYLLFGLQLADIYSLSSTETGSLDFQFTILIFILGLAAISLAMYFDLRDPARVSDANDIAFWLHLLAAPLLVNPIYSFVDITNELSVLDVVLSTVIYLVLALAAVLINRRAILVAGAGYLITTIGIYLDEILTTGASIGISLLLIGGILLVLAVWWLPFRAVVLSLCPERLRNLLPNSE